MRDEKAMESGRASRLLAAWRTIARALAEAKTLNEAAPAVLEAAGTAEGWRLATLWWVEGDRIKIHTTWRTRGIPNDVSTLSSQSEYVKGADSAVGKVWEEGKTITTKDVVIHPVRVGDEIAGAIEVYREVEPPESMLETIEYIGWQLAQFVDRKRLADALRGQAQAEARLVEADRLASLGSLAGGIAHEINNALTYVRLSLGRLITLELSRRPLTPVRFHRIELLQDVREGFMRVERVVKELKSFSKVDDGAVGPLDIPQLLDSIVRVAGTEIHPRAKLVCDYGEVPPVAATPGALRQVFLNLLLNAAQSIPEGKAEDNEIRVVTRTDSSGRVIVEVKDTGQGIPSDLMPRIFDPFFTTKPAGRGIGLGLSICRDIVTSLGGEITAESAPGHGTTVRVSLPSSGGVRSSRSQASTPSSTRIKTTHEAAEERGSARVLIIDDDRPVAAAIALELSQYDVVVADSGREALDILRRDQEFDVVFCDLMMPDITGMDLYETLKREEPELVERFVFMTGGAFTTRSRVFLAEVSNPRIDKPFQPEALHAIVQRFVQPREAHALESKREKEG